MTVDAACSKHRREDVLPLHPDLVALLREWLPQLKPGDIVRFQPFHVIDTSRTLDDEPERREYWKRCLVDKCVTDDGLPVHFLYREEPDPGKSDDKFPDSGWRIRGDYRGLSDAEIDARELEYVAIARVLNRDDSWLHLVDAPIGSAFIKDFETGEFRAEKKMESDGGNG